jgi:glutamate-1-semialdehyde 2,1-aminomutase
MAAGEAALAAVASPSAYDFLEMQTSRLADGLAEAGEGRISVSRVGSLLTVFFASAPPQDYDEVRAADGSAFARFFHAMLDRGVLLPPSPFEAWFTTLAHGDAEIDRALDAARQALPEALGPA